MKDTINGKMKDTMKDKKRKAVKVHQIKIKPKLRSGNYNKTKQQVKWSQSQRQQQKARQEQIAMPVKCPELYCGEIVDKFSTEFINYSACCAMMKIQSKLLADCKEMYEASRVVFNKDPCTEYNHVLKNLRGLDIHNSCIYLYHDILHHLQKRADEWLQKCCPTSESIKKEEQEEQQQEKQQEKQEVKTQVKWVEPQKAQVQEERKKKQKVEVHCQIKREEKAQEKEQEQKDVVKKEEKTQVKRVEKKKEKEMSKEDKAQVNTSVTGRSGWVSKEQSKLMAKIQQQIKMAYCNY